MWGACFFGVSLGVCTHATSAQSTEHLVQQRDSLQKVLQGSASDTSRVNALNALAYFYTRTSKQYDSALYFASVARTLAFSLGFKRGGADACKLAGDVYRFQVQYAKALEQYFASLQLCKECGYEQGAASVLILIGEIFRYQNMNSEALDYNAEAKRIAEKIGDKEGIAVILNNSALIYKYQGNTSKALEYFQTSLAMATQLGLSKDIGFALSNIGALYNIMQDYAKAQDYGEQALSMAKNLGDQRVTVSALNVLSYAACGQGRYRVAQDIAHRAIALSDSAGIRVLNDEGSKGDALLALSIASDSLGDHQTAFALYRQYIAFRDSLLNEKSLNAIRYLKERNDNERKDNEIQLLQKDKEQQAIVRNFTIAGLGIVMLALLVVVRLYRQKQHANEEILRQQHILEEQATEIEMTNTELQEQNTLLENLNKEKNEFLGIAAHDMKSPLASIMISAGLMRRKFDKMDKNEVLKMVTSIEQTVKRMSVIISNLLDINAIETGKMNLSLTALDIVPILHQSIEDVYYQLELKNIHVHISFESERMMIHADFNAVAQVVNNLLSNAVKYSPKGKPISVRLVNNGAMVRLEVQDEGQGITPEEMQKLFGKFVRLSTRPTGGEDSTGLGLSIVKKMVDAMNGKVWCESEPGQGARFIVELPKG
jgi:signal transduction histidine kinase